jgi:hypothetical protein
MWNEMDTDPFIKGKRGESQAFGVDVVLSDEAFMFENQQLTVPTPDFLTLSFFRRWRSGGSARR